MKLSALLTTTSDFLHYVRTGQTRIKNYDLTSVCNLNCSYCYYYNGSEGSTIKNVSDEEMIAFLKEEKRKGVHSVFLTGGEPLLRKNIVNFIDREFRKVVLVTNGMFPIDPSFRRKVFVSLDGPREIHNELRGADCYDRIVKNIQGDKRIVVTVTLSTTNYRTIGELYTATKAMGIRGITFSLVTSNHKDDPMVLRGEALDAAVEEMERIRSLDPDFVLVSRGMIRRFRDKQHIAGCSLRNGYVVSHNADLTTKSPCVLGEQIDCSTCGCSVPIIIHQMKRLDLGTFKVAAQLF